MTGRHWLFEPLTTEELNELAGWPVESQHVLLHVRDLIVMAHEQAAREMCESRLPHGSRVVMGRSMSRVAARSYFASAVGPRKTEADAFAVGYGPTPAYAYVDLVRNLAEKGM